MEIALYLGLINLATKAAEIIEEKVKSGEVTKEEQETVHAAYAELQAGLASLQSQPGWKIRPDPAG